MDIKKTLQYGLQYVTTSSTVHLRASINIPIYTYIPYIYRYLGARSKAQACRRSCCSCWQCVSMFTSTFKFFDSCRKNKKQKKKRTGRKQERKQLQRRRHQRKFQPLGTVVLRQTKRPRRKHSSLRCQLPPTKAGSPSCPQRGRILGKVRHIIILPKQYLVCIFVRDTCYQSFWYSIFRQ